MNYSLNAGICQKTIPTCTDSCETCLSVDSNECSKPQVGYYLDFNNSVRLYSIRCKTGQYYNYQSKQCLPCHAACLECADNTSTNCFACSTDYFKYSTHCLPMPLVCKIFNGEYIDLTNGNNCKQCPS